MMSRLRKNANNFSDKLKDYNLTIWSSNEGPLRIRTNYNGALIYMDVDNSSDEIFNNIEDLIKFLKRYNAQLIGYESENDW